MDLPDDCFDYCDTKFFDFARKLADPLEAELFEIQHVRSVPSLLKTHDSVSIMELDCLDLNQIKDTISFKVSNGPRVVKAAVKGNMEFLIEAFSNKNELHLKQQKVKCSKTVAASIAKHSSSSPVSHSRKDVLSKDDHEKFIVDSLSNWGKSNSDSLRMNELELIYDSDFTLAIQENSSQFEATIHGTGRTDVKLLIQGGKFQISNYYKHLKAVKCQMMKQKKKIDKEAKQQQQQSSSNTETSRKLETSKYIVNYMVLKTRLILKKVLLNTKSSIKNVYVCPNVV
ncbi:unnamed protein product [Didymodactylos carnosus]|uniref:Uncharacterized protein n=1 Tax=Didymodactylos carnosus TaxID=1234261 RepID=A0A815GJA2_9BILA|nr:unnamed protein product [Didymodactylos carnosus]CAF1339342.1 unnamed protein product [Didymodactylos carnosus]CAF4101602.1 unnamed protein product [Didymodactylos carnosus]CAF4199069.1 unnamed protein product [Didymodactylos carnosus]